VYAAQNAKIPAFRREFVMFIIHLQKINVPPLFSTPLNHYCM